MDGTAKQIAENTSDITALNVGTGGKTPDLPFSKPKQTATPKKYNGYRDSKQQVQVWTRK